MKWGLTVSNATDAERARLRGCRSTTQGSCLLHGGRWSEHGCPTLSVLQDVQTERARQFARYGTNADLEDGTGPEVNWIEAIAPWGTQGLTAQSTELAFRRDYERYEKQHGLPTWMHLIREEVAEAFMEEDSDRLCEELIQVAALCVSWVETKRAQKGAE